MEGSDSQWDVSSLFGAGALGGGGMSAALAASPPALDDQEDYYLAVSVRLWHLVTHLEISLPIRGGQVKEDKVLQFQIERKP